MSICFAISHLKIYISAGFPKYIRNTQITQSCRWDIWTSGTAQRFTSLFIQLHIWRPSTLLWGLRLWLYYYFFRRAVWEKNGEDRSAISGEPCYSLSSWQSVITEFTAAQLTNQFLQWLWYPSLQCFVFTKLAVRLPLLEGMQAYWTPSVPLQKSPLSSSSALSPAVEWECKFSTMIYSMICLQVARSRPEKLLTWSTFRRSVSSSSDLSCSLLCHASSLL